MSVSWFTLDDGDVMDQFPLVTMFHGVSFGKTILVGSHTLKPPHWKRVFIGDSRK